MRRFFSVILALVGIVVFGYGLLMVYESPVKDFETALIAISIGVILLFAALYVRTKQN